MTRAQPVILKASAGHVFIGAQVEFRWARYLLLTVPWAAARATWLSTS